MEQNKPVSAIEKLLFIAGALFLAGVFYWQLQPGQLPQTPDEVATSSLPGEDNRHDIQHQIEEPDYASFNVAPDRLEELHYFREIAFGSEHALVNPRIRKWTENIVIRVEGSPTEEDRKHLSKLIDELNDLQSQITISENVFAANLVIHFAPRDQFSNLVSRYIPGNQGFFWVRWIDDVIYNGTILVDSEGLSAEDRYGTLREELTQALGLMNASSRIESSIFNDDSGSPALDYADIDRMMIRMLYHDAIEPGMTPLEAITILANSTPGSQPSEGNL